MSVFLGVDFGVRAVKIFREDMGIVLREPNISAVDTKGNVVAVGTEALLTAGRSPGTVTLRRPMQGAGITDFNLAAEVLDRFLEIAAPHSKKHILASARYGLGTRNRELLKKALSDCKTGRITLVDSAPAAMLGSGFTPAEDEAEALSGTIICDIGAGCVEASYIRSGELLRTETVVGAGDGADSNIVTYLRRNFGIVITENSAKEAKHTLSIPCDPQTTVEFTGTDSSTGMPRRITVSANALLECAAPQTDGAVQVISKLIENLPRHGEELSSVDRIILLGGGANLPGIGEYIENELELSINLAVDPADCTVKGLGKLLRDA